MIAYVRIVVKCGAVSIVAREVNFGMAVALMISVEQRAIETVVQSARIYPTRLFA